MMSTSNHYQIYINATIKLAKTIVIKSQDTVDALNQWVNEQAAIFNTAKVDTLVPTSWKYYLNISGNYHILDTMMTVVSLDTLETIDFTKANLAMHPATVNAYQFGSRLYQILVDQFPTQEMLIKGILYPADINIAIAAKDGAILTYPNHLVEVNEYSLITKLQRWIDGYKVRWYNQQYSISDNLYPAVSLGIMYVNLVPAILNIRLEACRTNEAHSFHIKQYLTSHGLTDDHIDDMNTSQALFFYRNIAYIERNSGKQFIFDWLIQNLITARNLPMAEYEMRHDLTNQPANIYPELVFYKKALNSQYDSSAQTKLTLKEMLTKENPLARDNASYEEDYLQSIKESMENSPSNRLLTKVLESSVLDDSNSSPFNIADILLNHWIFLSSSGNYRAFININNPKTGDTISLSVLDAFKLAWYAFCNSVSVNPAMIPDVMAIRVQRIMTGSASTVASIAEIMSVVDSKLVSETTAQQALSMQPEIGNILSTKAFYDLCKKIYDAAQMQRNLVASQQLSVTRAMTLNMVSRIYSDNVCKLAPANTLYTDWLLNNNIDIIGLTPVELSTLYTHIVQEATGASLVTVNTLKDLQTAMMSLLTQLSSYSVQFVSTINDSNEIKTDWTATRINDIKTQSGSFNYVQNLAIGLQDIKAMCSDKYAYPIDGGNLLANTKTVLSLGVKVGISKMLSTAPIENNTNFYANMGRVGIRSATVL